MGLGRGSRVWVQDEGLGWRFEVWVQGVGPGCGSRMWVQGVGPVCVSNVIIQDADLRHKFRMDVQVNVSRVQSQGVGPG